MSSDTREPYRRSDSGDPPAAADLEASLTRFRPRLERMLAVRLDPRVRRRVDPEDVLQEAFLEVTRRLDDYLQKRPMSFFLWVRLLTGQKLAEFHRRHLDSARRDADREVTPGGTPMASSASLAGLLVDPGPSPPQAAARIESLARVQKALEELEEVDREVLALRHFEGMSNEEAAAVLGLSVSGVKKRHVAAIRRLRFTLPQPGDVVTP